VLRDSIVSAGRLLLPLLLSPPGAFACAQAPGEESFADRLAAAALERTSHRVHYDGSYRPIPYPGGDVPDDVGVCTDLVIRACRAAGVDLQREVHEDMKESFSQYPRVWGLARPDPNIDHRRVLNLKVFLRRRGRELPVMLDPDDYLPGDLVTWRLPRGVPHIGVVVDRRSPGGERPLIVHNIGSGPKLEDSLFPFTITGHYRYHGPVTGD
jgi:uncharacterized protein YijF (DUF1287 family)